MLISRPKAFASADPGTGSNEMKRRAVIAALAIGISFPVSADDQPPGKAQPPYLLRLSDIMVATGDVPLNVEIGEAALLALSR